MGKLIINEFATDEFVFNVVDSECMEVSLYKLPTFIDKDDALKIIKHLQEQFNLTT